MLSLTIRCNTRSFHCARESRELGECVPGTNIQESMKANNTFHVAGGYIARHILNSNGTEFQTRMKHVQLKKGAACAGLVAKLPRAIGVTLACAEII